MNDSKKWVQVMVPCGPESTEAVSNYFFENGCSGLEETDDGIRGFFPQNVINPKFNDHLISFVKSLRSLGFQTQDPQYEDVPDEDWSEGWRDYFKPVIATPNLIVKPPWETWEKKAGQLVIDINPKMAFGTGTHETTRLCLEMIEQNLHSRQDVLDLGAGSAVLSIAAAKLGAGRVLGVEIDPDAVENAIENIGLNGVGSQVEMRTGSIEQMGEETFDLVIANINRIVLSQLLPELKQFCRSSSQLILSGILHENRVLFETVIAASGFRVLASKIMGEWIGFLCELI